MARKLTRIAVEKVFATRELSKGVTTLTIAKVLQRDHRKIKRHVTTRNVFNHNYSINRKRVACVYGVIMHAGNVRRIREKRVKHEA